MLIVVAIAAVYKLSEMVHHMRTIATSDAFCGMLQHGLGRTVINAESPSL